MGADQRGLTGGVLAAFVRIEEQSDEAQVLIVGRKNADVEEPSKESQRGIGIDRKAINRAAARSGARIAVPWNGNELAA